MRAASALAGLLAAASTALAATPPPDDFVIARRGSLPILLTAPHGGRLDIPGVRERNPKDPAVIGESRKWGGVTLTNDPNTDVIALRTAEELGKLLGRSPYVVVARFNRKFIDANRPPEVAYGDDAAAPYYERYHRSVRAYVDEMRRTYPAGVLLDVHGQHKDPDALMRGTLNGLAVQSLVRHAGAAAITGPDGLFGQFESRGFKVFPANSLPIAGKAEDAGFNGGYTVRLYGSHRSDGIDAIQLEYGTRYRRKDTVDKTATDTALAIATFYKAYLADRR